MVMSMRKKRTVSKQEEKMSNFDREEYINQLDDNITELKASILGEYPDNEEGEQLDSLIDLAIMFGEQCAYRDFEKSSGEEA